MTRTAYPTKPTPYVANRSRSASQARRAPQPGRQRSRENEAPSGPKRVPHYLLGRRERYLIEISMSEPAQTKSLKRGRGRPRLFDRTAAIEQAMEFFWDRGYEETPFQ